MLIEGALTIEPAFYKCTKKSSSKTEMMDEEIQSSTHPTVPNIHFSTTELMAESKNDSSDPDIAMQIAYYLQGVILTPVAILGLVGKLLWFDKLTF